MSVAHIVDWRASADYSQLTRKADAGNARALFDAHGRVILREPARITGIALHVTDCHFGASKAAIKEHGLPRAIHERARRIPAHTTVFRDGAAVVPFDLRAHLHHANGLNPSTLGIEIERKSGDGDMPEVQLEAVHLVIDFLVNEGREIGMPLELLWAHRQSNGGKPLDPGPYVWRHVALPASARHGLTRHVTAILPRSTPRGRDGLPIPSDWEVPL